MHSPTAIAAVAMRFMRHESWDDALFVHYPVDAAALQRRLPPGLVVDTHDGVAYVGVVLLTESCEPAEGVDARAAEQALEQAEKDLAAAEPGTGEHRDADHRAQMARARASA